MHVLLAAMILLFVSGLLAFVAGRSPRLSTALGAGGAAIGCALGLIPAVRVLIGGETEAIHRAWDVPYGSFAVALDPLSAWFVVPILGLSGLAAIYAASYLRAYAGRKSSRPRGSSLTRSSPAWFSWCCPATVYCSSSPGRSCRSPHIFW